MSKGKTKTHKYLLPAIVFGYDKDFRDFIIGVARQRYIVNTYIDDILCPDINEECIYIILNFKGSMRGILEEFRKHRSYADDYPIGDFDDLLHMLVLRVPINHRRAYSNFMISRYSIMYDSRFLSQMDGSFNESTLGVLSKTEDKREEVMKRFGITDPKWKAVEYDSKLDFTKELYNYSKVIELIKEEA